LLIYFLIKIKYESLNLTNLIYEKNICDNKKIDNLPNMYSSKIGQYEDKQNRV